MSKPHSNLRFREFAKAAAAGAFAGAIALQPLPAMAATGSIQVSAANAKWFVNTNITFSSTSSQWGLSEASLHTGAAATALSYNRNDAYDGVLAWHVFLTAPSSATSQNGYRDPGGVVSTDTSYGTTLTGSVQVLAGLNVSGEMYFSPTKAVVRSMLVLQNPSGADINAVVGNYNNLGSDNNTLILATSSGDATFDSTDNWFVSAQKNSSTGLPDLTADPILTFALQDGVASVRASNIGPVFTNGNDNPNFDYSVTVPAGATRRLIIFSQLSDTPANAEADAASFNSTTALRGTDYLHGLTTQELSEVVNWNFLATPSIAVTSALNPSSYGQSIPFTATLTNATSPTGTVTICADDATCVSPVASCTATVTGTTASCNISTLPPGAHSITAIYSGDTFNTLATSVALAQQVNRAMQTITFGAQAPETFSNGATFALSPVASASSGLPVSYTSPTPSVCTIINTTVTLHSAGTCTIDADQAGNSNYLAAPTAPQNIAIGVDPTTISLTASPNPAQYGQTVTLVATVIGDPPTGTVSFYDGAVLLGTGTLNGGSPDQATFSTASLSPGQHSLRATYNGDSNNAVSTTAAALVESVNFTPVPSPTLGRWALLLLGGLMGLIARFYRRAGFRR